MMLSEAKFTELLEELVGHDQVEIPDILLPVVWRFWESDDTASAMQALQAGNDARLLPAALSDAVRYHLHDDAKYLVQTNPGYALAALLTMIWVGQVRNPRLQQVAEAISRREHWKRVAEVIGRREIRMWAECLIPVARYLEPALDGSTSKRGHPNILNYIGDVTWVEQWIGPGELAHEVADLAKDIPIGTYQRWRAAGVKQLWSGVKTILSGPPLTAAEIAATLPAVSTTAVLRPTRTSTVVEMSPLSNSDLNPQPFLPPLPRLRIERQQQPDIITALLNGQHRAIVLYGGAGMGKTTLAGQVLRAPEVQAAFPGGIAWAPGDSSVEEIAAAWCAALNLKRNPNTTWTQCWRQGGANMEKTLLVLDDVVNLSDAAVLVDGFGPDAVVLLTTQFGAETWEALAHSWLEPEAIWRVQIGAFTPTEARTLVEQAQGRPLTTEEWEIVELIGIHTGWEPTQLVQVASQAGLDAWLYMLDEMETDELPTIPWEQAALQWKRLSGSDLQQWLIQLARHMLTPSHFGLLYAAGGAWRVTPGLAFHRLEQLERAGLVERVQSMTPEKEETALWRIRPSILSQFWRPRRHLLHRLFIQWHYPRISRSIAQVTRAEWLPWPLNVFVGMPITLLVTPVYLSRVLYAKLKTPPKRQAAPSKTSLSLEYLISTDATTVVAVQLLCGLLAPVIFLFVAAALLPLLPLTPLQQARIADSIWFKPQTWIIFGLGWFLLHMGRLSWTLD